jgi:3-oxoacyl-[acyl-carrier-protein] synthase III
MIYVNYIDYYIPQKKLSIAKFVENIDFKMLSDTFDNKLEYLSFLTKKLKLSSIPIEITSDQHMLEILCKNFVSTYNINTSEIDAIILAQENANYNTKNLVRIIKTNYRFHNAITFCISGNNCANFHLTTELSKNILCSSNKIRHVLVIGVVKINDINCRSVGKYGVIGDAAGLMLLSKKDQGNICLIDSEFISSEDYLKQESANTVIIHFKNITNIIYKILKRNNKSPADFEKISMQNANTDIVAECLLNIGFTSNQFFTDNQGKYGHLDSLDYVVNLYDLSYSTNKSSNILCIDTGKGGSYIISYYQIRK